MADAPSTISVPKGKINSSKVFPKSSRSPEQRADTAASSGGGIPVREYRVIARSISDINQNLLGIKSLLADDIAQDDQAAADETRDNKRKKDAAKKGLKESFLESSIVKAFKKPVAKIQKKTTGIFEDLFKAINSLFGAWLLDKGQKLMDAWTSGDMNQFHALKGEVLKALAIAGGIFLLLNGGLTAIISSISGFVAGMITGTFGIPALLAVLANPLVWLGVGAVLGRYLQMNNEAEQFTHERIQAVGLDQTIKEYEERLRELTAKDNRTRDENREMQSLTRQLDAMRQGYHGTGDIRYREAGNIIQNWSVPFLNPQNFDDTGPYKRLRNASRGMSLTSNDYNNIALLTRAYRDLSRLVGRQERLKVDLLADPTNEDLLNQQKTIEEQIVVEQTKIQQHESGETGLPAQMTHIINEVKPIIDNDATPGLTSSKELELMAIAIRNLWPTLLERGINPNSLPETGKYDSPLDADTNLSSSTQRLKVEPFNSASNGSSMSNASRITASNVHGQDNITHNAIASSSPIKKGSSRVEIVNMGDTLTASVEDTVLGEVDGYPSLATSNRNHNDFIDHFSAAYRV